MPHLTRQNMYKQIKECLIKNQLFPMKGNILGISGINQFYPFIDFNDSILEEVNYPDVDIQNLPYSDDSFDVIISDQVLEHIEDPQRAFRESFRVLRRKGISIHTTCFFNFIHKYPNDFWRFTPDALLYLSTDFSEVLDCKGWGNRIAILLCFLGNRFRLLNIPETKWSLRNLIANYNETQYPIVTWIITKK
jgi:SAM-dependent methyltransferase